MQKLLLPLIAIAAYSVLPVACNNIEEENYVSLKVYKDFDENRTFDTTTNRKAVFYYRPVKIDLFYPSAEKPATAALAYGDILNIYEQRMNYNNPIDSCKKVSNDLAKAIAEYLHFDSASKILTYKTEIFTDLKLPAKKYPLIIYAAGMNGSSWENIILFDSLVNAGYIVAAVSSVGKFPGYMTAAVDLDEQVKDLLYTKQKMKQLSFIDTANIGLLSWSLGGSAITKTAMISNDIKCLLSFDGTEIHYYGFDTAWDSEFNEIKNISPYNPAAITVPYMYLSSEHPKNIDSIYLFPQFISSKEKYFLQFNGGIHENFSSIVSIVKNVAPKLGNIDSSRHQIICSLTLTYFNQYLKQSKGKTTAQFINQLALSKPLFVTTAYPKTAN